MGSEAPAVHSLAAFLALCAAFADPAMVRTPLRSHLRHQDTCTGEVADQGSRAPVTIADRIACWTTHDQKDSVQAFHGSPSYLAFT